MNVAFGSAARRELGVVFGLAALGIALVLVVVFTPWYQPAMASTPNPSVVQTIPPAVSVAVQVDAR